MAISGPGLDFSFIPSSYLKTSTSQYKVVGMAEETTTADWTVYLANNGQTLNDTMTARAAIGICQDVLSAGSENVTVRVFGISKAYASASIAAGDLVYAYEGASTTTYAGAIVKVADLGASVGVGAMSTASYGVILGRNLVDCDAGEYTTILLMPSPQALGNFKDI